ncbi:NAD(P)-dependent oxidoreductase [Isoptericola sp. CG 20/1183]|uniref:NAD(P)-dependent oxidoreductase n=1 Tax=Isoptericola sp. CG 20/1183 TaxID=1881052 RepID=UPI000D055DFE|nr:NAD(P)-dependent oxidoreductase [Isoptericola sp. CG 20/1183]
MRRLRAAFALRQPELLPDLFDATARDRLVAVADVAPEAVTAADGEGVDRVLRDVEVLVTGWGAPRLDAELLARAPRLRAVVHAAGSVKKFVTEEVWTRGIDVSSAATANARPVAEYTLAMILLAGKRVLESAAAFDRHRSFTGWHLPPHGNNGLVVGLVGASRTGRQVLELLAPFDTDVLLHDPFVDAAEARSLGATAVGLDELLRRSDVVSLHAPW